MMNWIVRIIFYKNSIEEKNSTASSVDYFLGRVVIHSETVLLLLLVLNIQQHNKLYEFHIKQTLTRIILN